MKTLNQIKAKLQELANNHAQIGSYGDGREWDIEANGAKKPSVMWSVLKSAQPNTRELTVSYDLFFLDLVKPDESHLDDVMSDQLQIACDMIAWLGSEDNSDLFYAVATGELTPAFEEFDNTWYGWHVQVDFRMGWDKNECAVPNNN